MHIMHCNGVPSAAILLVFKSDKAEVVDRYMRVCIRNPGAMLEELDILKTYEFGLHLLETWRYLHESMTKNNTPIVSSPITIALLICIYATLEGCRPVALFLCFVGGC